MNHCLVIIYQLYISFPGYALNATLSTEDTPFFPAAKIKYLIFELNFRTRKLHWREFWLLLQIDPIIFCILDKAQELAWKAARIKTNKQPTKTKMPATKNHYIYLSVNK